MPWKEFLIYAKIFSQIFDSSIADNWKTRHVFEDMLKLADPDGVVDMTQEAIAARARLPLEMVQNAIKELESPDHRSRSADCQGRRIVRLDPHRDWGWIVVNYSVYRKMRLEFDRKSYMRKYMRTKRSAVKQESNISLTSSNDVNSPPYVLCSCTENKDRGVGEGEGDVKQQSNTKRFTKPTLDEAKLQAAKVGLPDSEAERFFHYYESNGWRVGKNPMKSWQSAMINWRKNYQAYQLQRKGSDVPLWRRIQLLEEQLNNHPANRESIRHNKNASDEEKEDYRRKKEQLVNWKMEAIRAE